jgi:chorismate mutase
MSSNSARVCRGVRGATTAEANTRTGILAATRELLEQLVEANQMRTEDIASVMFTLTADLTAEYPAVAAREMGWGDVPLMCAQEIERPGALPRAIRVLILWNTTLPQAAIQHIYHNGAEVLRPDLVSQRTGDQP